MALISARSMTSQSKRRCGPILPFSGVGVVVRKLAPSVSATARPRVSIADAQREVTRQGSTQIVLPGGGVVFKNEGTYILKGDAGTFKAGATTQELKGQVRGEEIEFSAGNKQYRGRMVGNSLVLRDN